MLHTTYEKNTWNDILIIKIIRALKLQVWMRLIETMLMMY